MVIKKISAPRNRGAQFADAHFEDGRLYCFVKRKDRSRLAGEEPSFYFNQARQVLTLLKNEGAAPGWYQTDLFFVWYRPETNAHSVYLRVPEDSTFLVRFIDTEYRTLFYLPVGADETAYEMLVFADRHVGSYKKEVVRSVHQDEYHLRVGCHCYHICEFAELVGSRNGYRLLPESFTGTGATSLFAFHRFEDERRDWHICEITL